MDRVMHGFRPMAGILAAIIGILAWGGWIQAAKQDRLAGDGITQEIESLDALVDGMMEERRRLWVITIRTPQGMLRWSGTSAEEAAQWAEAAMKRFSGEPDWYVNVQGELAAAATLDWVWDRIVRETGGEAAEAYEDVTTYSYGFTSPQFPRTLRSGGVDIGLQAAAHLDTQTQRWRITLGTPAILIEY